MLGVHPFIGWGPSAVSVVQKHAFLDATVMFVGCPQEKCEHEKQACAICLLHFVEGPISSMSCYPYWHAEFEHHMTVQVAESVAMVAGSAAMPSLLSLCLPGNYDSAHFSWLLWNVQCHLLFIQWAEMLWQRLVLKC